MNASDLVYSFALGLAAALNPCGFPLLPAYLAIFLDGEDTAVHARILRALRAAAAMTSGFVLVFAVAGLAVAAGLRLGLAWTPYFTAALGLVLLVVGVFSVAGKSVRLPVIALPFRSGKGPLAMAGYGAAFAATSLGCTLPLFLAAASPSVTEGAALAALTAAVAYAVGMGIFVAACSVVAALLGAEAVRVAGRRFARFVPRIASVLLIVVGVYLLAYGTRLVVQPAGEHTLSTYVAGVADALGSAVSAHPLIIGATATLIVVAALSGIAIARRRRTPTPPEQQ
ncbi:cytochrome c biogenesis protein CcdA [Leifsonia shinshuensis]|uniref:cytochrome c biogenesis protein CcdA n=1 Tax=Leifsonia shinshuensis TaxID=150026 RepID=UPI001627858A|nr:cytochrome c biogenesis protein CcdA [Leifsonia shinshuensis]